MTRLLKECHVGLKQAVEELKVDCVISTMGLEDLNLIQIDNGTTLFGNISEMQKKSERMHKELLELISTLSDGTISDHSSSVQLCPHLCLIISNQLIRFSCQLMVHRIGDKLLFLYKSIYAHKCVSKLKFILHASSKTQDISWS
jgi:hypothetical protein